MVIFESILTTFGVNFIFDAAGAEAKIDLSLKNEPSLAILAC
jgi:hypothetical protein